MKKGKSLTGKYYKDVVLKKLKKKISETAPPVMGFKHVRLVPVNATAHTSDSFTNVLQKAKVTVLPHPPYLSDLTPCDFFLFPKLKFRLIAFTVKLNTKVVWCLAGMSALLAQLVEHLTCKQGLSDSSSASGTLFSP